MEIKSVFHNINKTNKNIVTRCAIEYHSGLLKQKKLQPSEKKQSLYYSLTKILTNSTRILA